MTASECKDWLTQQGFRFQETFGTAHRPAVIIVQADRRKAGSRRANWLPVLSLGTGRKRGYRKVTAWRKAVVRLGGDAEVLA